MVTKGKRSVFTTLQATPAWLVSLSRRLNKQINLYPTSSVKTAVAVLEAWVDLVQIEISDPTNLDTGRLMAEEASRRTMVSCKAPKMLNKLNLGKVGAVTMDGN